MLRERGIDPTRPVCMFAGLFERSYDLETVIDAARRLDRDTKGNFQFVLCGDGSKAPGLRARAGGLRDVHLLGWADAAMLRAVASVSTIGLCAYAKDALQSLPNKPFEYMASRLAVVSCLRGEMAELLEKHQCGVSYRAGDAESLAGALRRLLDDPVRLHSTRENAQRAWSMHYRSRDIYARFANDLTSWAATAKAA
jgi:glycosyltransferase involved in cell wall biosynthesis